MGKYPSGQTGLVRNPAGLRVFEGSNPLFSHNFNPLRNQGVFYFIDTYLMIKDILKIWFCRHDFIHLKSFKNNKYVCNKYICSRCGKESLIKLDRKLLEDSKV